MKKAFLFKSLIDILFFLHAFALPGFLVLLPLGASSGYYSEIHFDVENWSFLFWSLLVISLIIYIVFLRGLYFLRIVARFLMSKKYFTDKFILNIKKTGVHFLTAGVLYFILLSGIWINKIIGGKFEINYNTNTVFPLFIIVIGLFFIIQSKTLLLAKSFKDENELTV